MIRPRSVVLPAVFLALVAGDALAAGILLPRDGSEPIQVKSHRVVATVTDGLARTTLRQSFVSSRKDALEAVYIFPVPEGAAITGAAMETGGKRFEGLLAERKRARLVYDEIVRGRRDPAIVEQIGRNTFRLSVYPVLPDQETVVELTWVQHVPLTQGLLRYVYPLELVTDRPGRTRHDFTFTVTLESSVPFRTQPSEEEFPSGTRIVRKAPGKILVSHESMRTRLERDVVVRAMVAPDEPTLTVRTYREKTGDGWFLAVVTPPIAGEADLIPRDMLLLLDTSGSMRGTKLDQAKRAALYLLANLRPGDRVNVARFSTSVESYAPAPVDADLSSVAKLTGFVNDLEASGGTALGDAVREAAALPAVPGRVRTVVLITDGLPTVGETSVEKIVAFAKEAGAKGLRIFTFGVGKDAAPGLLRGISRASRGRAEVFKPEDQLEARLRVFLDRTASPVLAGIRFGFADLATYDVFPRPLPDAYLGEQIVLTGRYRGGGDKTVTVSATMGRSTVGLETEARFPVIAHGSPAVAELAGLSHLRYLEESLRLRLGLSDEAYFAALDKGAYSTKDEIVEEMIRVSLTHGVQCPYTSFLVLLPEDRARLNTGDPEAVTAALERAHRTRWELAPLLREAPSGGADGSESGDGESAPEDDVADLVVPEEDEEGAEASGYGFGFEGKDAAAPAASGPTGRRRPPPPPPKLFDLRGKREEFRKVSSRAELEAALDRALEWLAKNQEDDGRWRTALTDDLHDVGITGLALLAFLGAGEKPVGTPYSTTVVKGLTWLMAQQDAEGCFGMRKTNKFTYNHALATQAVAEAVTTMDSIFLKRSAQRGIDFIFKCQNPYLAWRYGKRPADNDTSVSTFMLMALRSGQDAGLRVDPCGFDGMRSWLDKVTEPEYGRAGYTSRGSAPGRPQDLMDKFPADKSEGLTAGAILCRVLIGEDPRKSEMVAKGANLCLKLLPVWDESSGSIDMYYWYLGTLAMFQVGGEEWKHWREAMYEILVAHQRRDADLAGSWDPIGPWGRQAGRVYSTAVMAICLEAEYFYPRLFQSGKRAGRRNR